MHTRRSPDLDIDLPRTAAISLRTVSGDVEALGIGGASRWASTSGDLRVTVSAGPVQLESMSGDAVVEASAAITLVGRTVSGDLKVRAPRLDGLDASTTSGDVRVEADLAAGSRHAISSVSGDVDVITGSPGPPGGPDDRRRRQGERPARHRGWARPARPGTTRDCPPSDEHPPPMRHSSPPRWRMATCFYDNKVRS